MRDTTAALIQPPHDLASHADPQTCYALTQIGIDARADLLPAPTNTLDDRIALWADLVESLGSSCERNQNIATMTNDLAELGNHIDELIAESFPSR